MTDRQLVVLASLTLLTGVAAGAFGAHGLRKIVTPELLGGPGGKLMANMIQSMFLGINKPTLGAALAVISMVSVGVVSLIFVLLCSRWLGGRQ